MRRFFEVRGAFSANSIFPCFLPLFLVVDDLAAVGEKVNALLF